MCLQTTNVFDESFASVLTSKAAETKLCLNDCLIQNNAILTYSNVPHENRELSKQLLPHNNITVHPKSLLFYKDVQQVQLPPLHNPIKEHQMMMMMMMMRMMMMMMRMMMRRRRGGGQRGCIHLLITTTSTTTMPQIFFIQITIFKSFIYLRSIHPSIFKETIFIFT